MKNWQELKGFGKLFFSSDPLKAVFGSELCPNLLNHYATDCICWDSEGVENWGHRITTLSHSQMIGAWFSPITVIQTSFRKFRLRHVAAKKVTDSESHIGFIRFCTNPTNTRYERAPLTSEFAEYSYSRISLGFKSSKADGGSMTRKKQKKKIWSIKWFSLGNVGIWLDHNWGFFRDQHQSEFGLFRIAVT